MGKGRSFVIGDVHGCAVELLALLSKLQITSDSRLYFVGDLIDRGEDSRQVVDIVLQLRKFCHVEVVLGNHEAMFVDFVRSPGTLDASMFIFNGGSATLASYADENGDYIIPPDHVEFIDSLPLYCDTEEHFIVHAGVPEIPLSEIDPQRHRIHLLWSRAIRYSSYNWEKLIVHGHTQRPEVEIEPNRFNVDAGCVYGGALAALDLHDHSVHYVQRHEVTKKYLKDPSSRREAVRFAGEVPIRIKRGERYAEFVTSNFNELGMFIQPMEGCTDEFSVGDSLSGVILPADRREIAFRGEIVRLNAFHEPMGYGIRIVLFEEDED